MVFQLSTAYLAEKQQKSISFCKTRPRFFRKFSKTVIIKILEFLIDNVFVMLGERVFKKDSRHFCRYQLCSSSRRLVLLFVRDRLHTGASNVTYNEKKLVRSFHFTFRYIDDILSLNNSKFGDIVERIYSTELEIKDTTDIATSVSYIDLHHEIDSADRLRKELCDKRDDSNFCELSIYV